MAGKVIDFFFFFFSNFGPVPLLLTFEQSFLSFSTLSEVFFINFFKLDSDPHLNRTAGSGSAKNECGSTVIL